jgi:putative ABC transport system substrate-binding protein
VIRHRHIKTVLLLIVSICASIQFVEAQQRIKIPRVGFIRSGTPNTESLGFEAFRNGLRELGYIEGRNIIIEYRSAAGNVDRLAELAAELVQLRCDVIVGNVPVIRAARQASNSVALVLVSVPDPVALGLVNSLARPGGNITGLSTLGADLQAKRLELLKEAVPRLSRVAILWSLGQAKQQLPVINLAAKNLGVRIQSLTVDSASDLESAFSVLRRERPDGLVVASSPVISTNRARIIEFTANGRLPAIYDGRGPDQGGLMSYGASGPDMYRRAATFVDKILKGAKPGDLPIEQATKFELVINIKAAKQIGITIPQNVMVRADQVIK